LCSPGFTFIITLSSPFSNLICSCDRLPHFALNGPSSGILLSKRLGLAPIGTLLIACSVQLIRQVLFSWVGALSKVAECAGGVVGSPFVEGGNIEGHIDTTKTPHQPLSGPPFWMMATGPAEGGVWLDDKKVHNGHYVSSGIAYYIKFIFSNRM